MRQKRKSRLFVRGQRNFIGTKPWHSPAHTYPFTHISDLYSGKSFEKTNDFGLEWKSTCINHFANRELYCKSQTLTAREEQSTKTMCNRSNNLQKTKTKELTFGDLEGFSVLRWTSTLSQRLFCFTVGSLKVQGRLVNETGEARWKLCRNPFGGSPKNNQKTISRTNSLCDERKIWKRTLWDTRISRFWLLVFRTKN
jgi:hypothetical protein